MFSLLTGSIPTGRYVVLMKSPEEFEAKIEISVLKCGSLCPGKQCVCAGKNSLKKSQWAVDLLAELAET